MARFGSIPRRWAIHRAIYADRLDMGKGAVPWLDAVIHQRQPAERAQRLDHRDRLQIAFYYGARDSRASSTTAKAIFKSRRLQSWLAVAPSGRGMPLHLRQGVPPRQDHEHDVNYSGGFLGVGTRFAIGVGDTRGVVCCVRQRPTRSLQAQGGETATPGFSREPSTRSVRDVGTEGEGAQSEIISDKTARFIQGPRWGRALGSPSARRNTSWWFFARRRGGYAAVRYTSSARRWRVSRQGHRRGGSD